LMTPLSRLWLYLPLVLIPSILVVLILYKITLTKKFVT
jgi:hypothetical protein